MPVEDANPSPKLIFSCSGAADTGEIAHQATRHLARHGNGRMFCLAGVGGRVEAVLDQTRAAEQILAIDGCDSDCASRTLELAGFSSFNHIRVTDLGLKKGESPVTRERVELVADRAGEQLG